MADLKTAQRSFSPDNRLSYEQVVAMAARLQDRFQVSGLRALKMVEETQAERQKILDERVKLSGGVPWSEMSKHPDADDRWGQPTRMAEVNP